MDIPTTVRDRAINLRVSRGQRDLIDRASRTLGVSRTEFMLETACRRAEDILLDAVWFRLEPDAFDRFVDLLESPPEPSPELSRLLNRAAPWE